MPIHPGMVEDLSAGVRDLYADAEQRLLGIVARQLADGFEAPGWATAKLRDIQALRRGAQGVVDALGSAVQLEVFDAVAEAYTTGARAGLAELGALHDDDLRRIAESTPNTRAVDRLAAETAELVTQTHRGILRGVEDGYRQVISEVSATPLLGIDTRRQATQRAMERFSDRGLRTFVDKGGRAWQMTSYAEMATRTATGRAAVEGHGDRLRAAGLDLVIVSNAPHNCPLCDPFEGKVLSLSGPDGARSVEVEHATVDDELVRVHILGSVDEARRRGFQHPNCRHSLSAYLPGVTRAPVEHSEDPDGYDASQKQRAIERGIRKWKNRAAASPTPEGKRAAEAKVRAWQKKQRDHLANHPELIRRREREQPGAGNLPPSGGTAGRPGSPSGPGSDPFEAARVRSGDARTLPEMSDEQLGAAMRPGVLDQRDLDRIRTEGDRRDEQMLLDRIRPNSQLAGNLAEFSDDELARVSTHLGDGDMLRVMAEMDRRDVDAALPGARRDLVGMSERELAARARNLQDDRSAIGAEIHRRRLLADVFPSGRLAGDLSGVGDDVLGWAVRYASPTDATRIVDEIDRRYPPAQLPDAAGAHRVEGQLADRATVDEVLAPAADADAWNGLSVDWYAGMSATERWIAEREYADMQQRTAYTRAQIREMYQEHLYAQVLDAEDATNGYMLTKAAQLAGVDPISLFSGPAHVAYARASEELKRWWADNPRTTLAEYEEMVTGQRSSAAETARRSGNTQQNRL
ncbi:phage minor capsid protein [Streptomyces sp. ASQP_92]|uniref:phage minor capsid protein n=1 Tax=Streptomyces sp. ASQP_92 TaxID=2979116 RepID=UPI0021C06A81|nr:phage minor capsid protein [Streptomyces sp. ASQP_92]MCT9090597.1 phage minor capsid protein [Streptomyces sp. ASQP_92]